MEKYAEIQAMVRKEIETMFNDLYDKRATQFGVSKTPFHTHNNVDSPILPASSLQPFSPIPANEGGAASPYILGGQFINNSEQASNLNLVGKSNSSLIYVDSIPVIYGTGSATSITFTSTRPSGSTSGTLTAPWGGTSGDHTIKFQNGEIRNGTLSNGSTSVSWSPGLTSSALASPSAVVDDALFKGGDAPVGTMLVFANDTSLTQELWVRINVDGYTDKWWGVTLDIVA